MTPPNFNPLARLYRWMEFATFGPMLQRCRCAFLPALADSRHALILGDGDGRFTARLLAANPQVRIHAVDASSAMLQLLLRNSAPHADRVHTLCADIRNWQPAPSPCDLVVTHFFLDCLTTQQVQDLAQRLSAAVSPSAIWLVSDFAIPSGWFGSFVARPIVSGLYGAFGLLTGLAVQNLPMHAQALTACGLTLQQRHAFFGGLLMGELWQFPPSNPI